MKNMNKLGRIIIRPDEKNNLILGCALSTNTVLKPNIIYELQDYYGELTIKEIGEPAMNDNYWNKTANEIIEIGTHLITKDEFEKLQGFELNDK